MKNLRKVVGMVVDEYLKDPAQKKRLVADGDFRGAVSELLEVIDGIASVAKSLDRIACVLEREEQRAAMRR